jgi:hypothetical protein
VPPSRRVLLRPGPVCHGGMEARSQKAATSELLKLDLDPYSAVRYARSQVLRDVSFVYPDCCVNLC